MNNRENLSEKIKSVIRFTQKRGTFLSVLDSKTDLVIGYTNGTERHIDEHISQDQRIEVLKAYDNFDALIELNAHNNPISRIFTRIPSSLKTSMNQAFVIAEQHKLDFKPSRAILRALTKEIAQTLKKIGIEPDLPTITDSKKSKHIAAREIFARLLPDKNEVNSSEVKGFKTTFDKHALDDFGKPPITLQYLFNYKYGKSKPPMWVYASALQALHDLKIDIFAIGLPDELIYDLWYSAYKDILDQEAIIVKFKQRFPVSDSSAFERYLAQRTGSDRLQKDMQAT